MTASNTTGTNIHETAVIYPGAQIGENVTVGPFSVIGPEAVIGDGTVVGPHVVITGATTVGKNCRFYQFSSIGEEPQDLKFRGEKSYVTIGDGTSIRECVTIHRATGEGLTTAIGRNCLIMATVHIAHNCILGDNVIMSNAAMLAGHVEVGDRVVIGGMTGVHQFVKIGRNAMVGGFSRLTQDVVPFTIVNGVPARTIGLNTVGLTRAGMSSETRRLIKQAYRLLFRSGNNVTQAIEAIDRELEHTDEITDLLAFLRAADRGVCRGASRRETEKE